MEIQVNKNLQVILSMSESEVTDLVNSISGLVMEKIDLQKYKPIFAIKDAIVLKEHKI